MLEAGLMMARVFDSYIEGFAVRPSAGTYVTVEPVSSLAISGAFDGDRRRNARAMFEAFMQSMACRRPTEPASFPMAGRRRSLRR